MDEITIRAARARRCPPHPTRLDVETWRAAYAGILATPFLVGLSARRRENRMGEPSSSENRATSWWRSTMTATFSASAAAVAAATEFAGEVYTLYVAPDWQNQGIGRRLLLALFERLVDQACGSAIIWVLRDNRAGSSTSASAAGTSSTGSLPSAASGSRLPAMPGPTCRAFSERRPEPRTAPSPNFPATRRAPPLLRPFGDAPLLRRSSG